jgi:hypothetical protein
MTSLRPLMKNVTVSYHTLICSDIATVCVDGIVVSVAKDVLKHVLMMEVFWILDFVNVGI